MLYITKTALNVFLCINKEDGKWLVFVQQTKFEVTILVPPNNGRSGGNLPTLC